jgi:hypothetical protein
MYSIPNPQALGLAAACVENDAMHCGAEYLPYPLEYRCEYPRRPRKLFTDADTFQFFRRVIWPERPGDFKSSTADL